MQTTTMGKHRKETGMFQQLAKLVHQLLAGWQRIRSIRRNGGLGIEALEDRLAPAVVSGPLSGMDLLQVQPGQM